MIHDVVAEGAYSQFELDFHYTNLLEMADRLVFLRILLKEIAKKNNMFITFMPKPTIGDWRSGAHINFSMIDKNGKNVFDGGNKWSKESIFAVGGLMKHAEALTSITCSTVNSYNGLVPRVGGFEGGTVTWAPTNITYGHNNRSAQFRLPQNRYCIENRAADMTMNVYLGTFNDNFSSLLKELKKKYIQVNQLIKIYIICQRVNLKNLELKDFQEIYYLAIEALKNDKLTDEVLGPVMKKSLLAYKNDEWERYHQAVTDWEVKEYLRLY